VFGDKRGRPNRRRDLDSLAKLHPDGVTRPQLSDLFSLNRKAREMERALGALVDAVRLNET
jgi:hypothetical protein